MTERERDPLDAVRGVVFGMVAIALLSVGTSAIVRERTFVRDSERAGGIVTRLNYGPAHPEIRFRTREGRSVTYDQGGFVSTYAGEHVDVRYWRDDPDRSAVLDTFAAIFGDAIVAVAIGIVFLGVAAGSFASLRRHRT